MAKSWAWRNTGVEPVSYKAENALSDRYRFVKQTGADQVDECGAGEAAFGVNQRAQDTAGKEVSVIETPGHTLLEVDGSGTAITVGSYLKSDADGKGVKTTTVTDIVCAVALEASSADGEYIEVRLIEPTEYGARDGS